MDCQGLTAVPSLPLMGIGNFGRVLVERPRDILLITPHGDWKQEMAARVAQRRLHSLPLMGIGNYVVANGPCEQLDGSLPLMGIGNAASRAA